MKFIVSFTTSPSRIYKCNEMLKSIIEQSVKPDLIILNIPPLFERTKEPYKIPADFPEIVTINNCKKDYGPATKIVPTIEYLKNLNYNPEETRIIYLDDDIHYPNKMIEVLKPYSEVDCVWAAAAFNFINFKIVGQRKHTKLSSIAEGYSGVCCKLSFFKDDFIDYMEKYLNNLNTKLSDDVILSNYYHKHKIPIRTFAIKDKYSLNDIWDNKGILEYGNLDDALHNGADGQSENNTKRYTKVIKELNLNKERYFKLFFISKDEKITLK